MNNKPHDLDCVAIGFGDNTWKYMSRKDAKCYHFTQMVLIAKYEDIQKMIEGENPDKERLSEIIRLADSSCYSTGSAIQDEMRDTCNLYKIGLLARDILQSKDQ